MVSKAVILVFAMILVAGPGFAKARQPWNCNCKHNNDAGRWRDALSPNDRIAELCSKGRAGCWDGERGKMCISGNLAAGCACAISAAARWQSHHGDWFLWSAVSCGDFTVTIT